MKTQIIALAPHDDLVSIRDRMSWAKAPRILLVWPAREHVALRPLDLRILQRHARQLGAEMGLVARAEPVRRDAQAFGIPVFRSAIEAQREPWGVRTRGGQRRTGPAGERLVRLREMRQQARPSGVKWISRSPVRMGAFVLAVLSVFALASLFVPRATIVLAPESQQQHLSLAADVHSGRGDALAHGGLPALLATTQVSGSQTMPVITRSEVPASKATGLASFQNLSAAPLLIPSGTVVYSLDPGLVRFVTLRDAQLDTGVNEIVEVTIEAVRAGEDGNLPPDSIDGVEGSLSASVGVGNRGPIEGGTSREQSVPSDADRDQLRTALEQTLSTQAKATIESNLLEGDFPLTTTLSVQSIEREAFDPPAGQAGSLLGLTLDATYQTQYVRGTDLRALALLALNAQMPAGYVPKEGTLTLQVNEISSDADNHSTQLQLDIQRTINRRIDLMQANQLVRGASPSRARLLLADELPLWAPPEIRLTPSWWPWLPLIPFRIEILEL